MSLTRLATPWYRRSSDHGGGGADQPGSMDATPILDHGSSAIADLARRAMSISSSGSRSILMTAHSLIRDEVRPVYAMDEMTPASTTLNRGSGSCSQRLAILESVARSIGVETRVRALEIDRSFWFPRFPRLGPVLPDRILLVWPELNLGGWESVATLFGPIGCRGGAAFSNRGAETLFEAAGRCAIDWDGRDGGTDQDLSRFVRADFGRFTNRDEAFARLGQTLCAPARFVADPILRRVAA